MANFIVVANERIREPQARFEDLIKRFLKQTQDSQLLATVKEHEEFTKPSLKRHYKNREVKRKILVAKQKRVKEKD
jgi:ribosomal protein S21